MWEMCSKILNLEGANSFKNKLRFLSSSALIIQRTMMGMLAIERNYAANFNQLIEGEWKNL